MAPGALIGAYQDDGSGGLRALYPLAGHSLLDYQVRCAAAAGAAPIVVLVERVPAALNQVIERLSIEGLPVVVASDGNEAASRFEAGMPVLVIADGLAPDFGLVERVAEFAEPVVALVPDDEAHHHFERVDATSRWAGVAMVDAHMIGATAAMLGDWDLQSTLLRRAVQEGARRLAAGDAGSGAILAGSPEDLAGFEKRLLVASRGTRSDWASRYALPMIEEFATEQLMESRVRPQWLVAAGLILVILAAIGFSRGWLWQSYLVLLASTPFDLVAARLAALRLKPLAPGLLTRRLLWPAAGVALAALGWRIGNGTAGWGAFLAALTAAAFAQAGKIERVGQQLPGSEWMFSRRNAILAAAPFVAGGWWTALLVALLLYAAVTLFTAQHLRHRISGD